MRKIFYASLFMAVILVAAATSAVIFQLNIPVGGLAKVLAGIVNISTDREISIAGSYHIVLGTRLQLICKNGEIAVNNPQGLNIIATVIDASTQIDLWSLLKKQVEIDFIVGHGVNIGLISGSTNITNNQSDEKIDFATLRRYCRIVKKIGDVDGEDINLSITQEDSAAPLVFHLDTITGSVGEKIPGQFNVEGLVQSQRIGLSLKTDPLENLALNDLTFNYSADMRYMEADIYLDGGIAHPPTGHLLDSTFSLKDLPFSEIVSILSDHKQHDQRAEVLVSCSGRFTFFPDKMTVELNSLLPGTDKVKASLAVHNDVSGKPIFTANITSELIDLDTLMFASGVWKKEKTAGVTQKGNNKIHKDVLILPEMLTGKSFNLNLDVDKLIVAGREITGLSTHTVMKNGVIEDAPFSAAFKNFSFQGQYSLDAAREIPTLRLQYTTNAWDVGATLKDAGLTGTVDLTIAQSSCRYKTFGRSLSDLIKNLECQITGTDGLLQLPDLNTGATLSVNIESFTLAGNPGKETTLQLNGQIAGNRIRASASIADERGKPMKDIRAVPFLMTVDREDTKLKLEGTLPVPFNFIGATINYSLSGSDMTVVEEIMKREIPLLGPYRFTGSLSIIPEGYRIRNLELAIGRSLLKGQLSIDTKSPRPRLSVDLDSEKFQLADLKKDSALWGSAAGREDNLPESLAKEQAGGTDWTVPENFDADVTLRVQELSSGDDYLGKGSISFKLNNGKISIAPAHISLPAGEIDAQFSMEPIENNRNYTLDMEVGNLDYGVVSRWFKPETDQGGILSLRSALQARVPHNEDFLAHADGYIDFCLQPENLHTGIVDLWAVNLISYLLPIFMPTSASRLNCIAGRFNISDGKMTQDDLLLDTSRIQVKGSLDVNFGRRWIEAQLRPIPKRPQFYSLATPVQVSGRLNDLNVGVAKGGLIGTMIRILTSYVVVPVQWAVRQKVPVDDTGQCLQIYNKREHREAFGASK